MVKLLINFSIIVVIKVGISVFSVASALANVLQSVVHALANVIWVRWIVLVELLLREFRLIDLCSTARLLHMSWY